MNLSVCFAGTAWYMAICSQNTTPQELGRIVKSSPLRQNRHLLHDLGWLLWLGYLSDSLERDGKINHLRQDQNNHGYTQWQKSWRASGRHGVRLNWLQTTESGGELWWKPYASQIKGQRGLRLRLQQWICLNKDCMENTAIIHVSITDCKSAFSLHKQPCATVEALHGS